MSRSIITGIGVGVATYIICLQLQPGGVHYWTALAGVIMIQFFMAFGLIRR